MENAKSVVVVSGLPRSGTSMMMRMLEAGGMPVMTDRIREADRDNPNGYYEFERVKQVKTDAGWLPEAAGKAVKMVSMLLLDLPPGHRYDVVFMQRKMEEVLVSQEKMLDRLGTRRDPADAPRMSELFSHHLTEVKAWLARQPHFRVLYVDYADAVARPADTAARVAAFLGCPLDTAAMAAVADQALYRNRGQPGSAKAAPATPAAPPAAVPVPPTPVLPAAAAGGEAGPRRTLRRLGRLFFHHVITPCVPHLPYALMRAAAHALGGLNHHVAAGRRARILAALRAVFPDRPDGELREICRRNFINHALQSLEILYLPAVRERFMRRHVNIVGEEHLRQALANGKGIVFAIGHMGPYYIAGVITEMMGVRMNDIAQPVSKLRLDDLDRRILLRRLQNYQSRIGGKVFERGGSLLGLIRAIRKNEAVSLFVDAMTTPADPEVDFLGHRMRSPQGPCRIARQTGAALLFSYAVRHPGGRIDHVFIPMGPVDDTGDEAADVGRTMQRCMATLDKVIRQHPDQWHLWRVFAERAVRPGAAVPSAAEETP